VLLLPPLIGLLRRRQILDTPGQRSLHVLPTPRGGGSAPIVAAVSVAAISGAPPMIMVAVVAFAVVGAVDDVRGLAARTRLALQVCFALAASTWLLLGGLTSTPGAVLAAFLLVVYVNAFNFMDGINGVSAMQALVVSGACMGVGLATDSAILVGSSAAMLGAAALFLPFNFPRAAVFLGDVGSYGIGAFLTLLLVLASARIGAWTVLIPAVYLVDVLWTLLRRFKAGEPLTEAHRDHVYQRLVESGGSHVVVSAYVTACSALVAAAAVLGGLSDSAAVRGIAIPLVVLVLGLYLAAPRCLAWFDKPSPRPAGLPTEDLHRPELSDQHAIENRPAPTFRRSP
jgi:UDP-N-acetylmuramyl pentapeptide phosphotransferase/UDP-N-acetylglucosamine-1-phosphate transferase